MPHHVNVAKPKKLRHKTAVRIISFDRFRKINPRKSRFFYGNRFFLFDVFRHGYLRNAALGDFLQKLGFVRAELFVKKLRHLLGVRNGVRSDVHGVNGCGRREHHAFGVPYLAALRHKRQIAHPLILGFRRQLLPPKNLHVTKPAENRRKNEDCQQQKRQNSLFRTIQKFIFHIQIL